MKLSGKKTAIVATVVALAAGTGTMLFASSDTKGAAQNGFMREFDLNKDGAVTEKEMIKAQEAQWQKRNPDAKPNEEAAKKVAERLKERFSKMDKNGDGKIKGEEIPGRQTVSKEDYLARAAENFDKMDANKDGKLTAEERDALRDKMKKAREAHRKEREKSAEKTAEKKQ